MSERYYFPATVPPVNVAKLDHRLRVELGLPIIGVSDELAEYQRVAVDFEGEATQDQLALVTAEIAAHDPVDYTPLVLMGAEAQARAIPGWAHWTEAQALDWFDANIADRLPVNNLAAANLVLADMATAMRALIRLVVALHSHTFPNLQGEGQYQIRR